MSADNLQNFLGYAEAFEISFASDDWSHVEAFFTDDIVWSLSGLPAPHAGPFAGVKNVIGACVKSCNTLDRRFELRDPQATEIPSNFPGGGIYLPFEVTYSHKDLPPFVLKGMEWDFFRDGKIALHREVLLNAVDMLDHINQHNDQLLPQR
jgi:hypothetical protein